MPFTVLTFILSSFAILVTFHSAFWYKATALILVSSETGAGPGFNSTTSLGAGTTE